MNNWNQPPIITAAAKIQEIHKRLLRIELEQKTKSAIKLLQSQLRKIGYNGKLV